MTPHLIVAAVLFVCAVAFDRWLQPSKSHRRVVALAIEQEEPGTMAALRLVICVMFHKAANVKMTERPDDHEVHVLVYFPHVEKWRYRWSEALQELARYAIAAVAPAGVRVKVTTTDAQPMKPSGGTSG